MANYNRTRLRSIDNTVFNQYLDPNTSAISSTEGLARTFSFRGRNCLSPIGDLENNNRVEIDSISTGTGYTLGTSAQEIIFIKDLLNLSGSFLEPELIKIFIGAPKKYATAIQNGDFGSSASFTAPTSGTAGATYITVCTPFGYQNFSFFYSAVAP